MKKIVEIWLLGIRFFGRWVFFTAAILLVSIPVRLITKWLREQLHVSTTVIIAIHVAVFVLIFPFIFYITARWMRAFPGG